MVWSQYKNDVGSHHNNDNTNYDDNPPLDQPMSYEEWKTWYSADLFNMWEGVIGYIRDTNLTKDIFKDGDYDDFCMNIYQFSSKRLNKNAT